MPQSYPIISIPTTCVQILNKKDVETRAVSSIIGAKSWFLFPKKPYLCHLKPLNMYCRYVKPRMFKDLFEVGKEYIVMYDVTSHNQKLTVSRGEGAEPKYVTMTFAEFHTSFKAFDKRTGKTFFLMPPVKPSSSYTPKSSEVFPAPYMDGGCGDGGSC